MKKDATPLVSVVIPCYNDYQHINEAVNSIHNQDYENLEIIIIDDGSDDNTKKVLEGFNKENVQIIFQENVGPSVARNNGIKAANGNYILTLDADDYFEPTFVSKAMEIMANNNEVGVVSCWGVIFIEDKITGKTRHAGGDVNEMIFANGALGSALFRKKCWIEVGGYDEKMRTGLEDWEFYISITKRDWKVYIIEEELYNYRDRKDSRNKLAIKIYKRDLIKYMMLKHKDVFYDNFERMLDVFLDEKERLINRGVNLKQSKEYKIGRFILLPARIVKWILNKKC